MNLIKATIATAAVTVCCLGTNMPAKAAMTTSQRAVCVRQLKNSLKDWP